MALINQLNNLGDAVRERTNTDQLYTLDEMAETIRNIPAGTEFYPGKALYLSDEGELGVNFENTLGVNSENQLGVIQENLYVIKDSYLPINYNIGPFAANTDLIVFGVGMRYSQTEVEAWLAEMASNPENLHLYIGTTSGGFGGKTRPSVQTDAVAVNGQTFNYIFNMSNAIGPNTQTTLGVYGVYVCYNIGEGRFRIMIERDVVKAMGDINRFEWGINNTVQSMAHYFIGRNSQFNRYRNNGTDYIEINENYINSLIDNKLDAIQMAEEVSV